MMQNFLWMAVVCEVHVIHKDLNWEEHASKQMLSMVEFKDKTHKFAISYIVVPFSLSEFPECSPDYKLLAAVILLEQGCI
jgi:hypothetical protein